MKSFRRTRRIKKIGKVKNTRRKLYKLKKRRNTYKPNKINKLRKKTKKVGGFRNFFKKSRPEEKKVSSLSSDIDPKDMYKIGSCYEKCKEKNGGEKCRKHCDIDHTWKDCYIDNVKKHIGPSSPPPLKLLNPVKQYHIKNTKSNDHIISTIDEFTLKNMLDNKFQDQTTLKVCEKENKALCENSDWIKLSEW